MAKKKVPKKYPDLNFDAFRWCIDNDFQVYISPLGEWKMVKKVKIVEDKEVEYEEEEFFMNGLYKIAVRRGGISSSGYDYYYKNEVKYLATETLSDKVYNKEYDALLDLNYVYKLLNRKYG